MSPHRYLIIRVISSCHESSTPQNLDIRHYQIYIYEKVIIIVLWICYSSFIFHFIKSSFGILNLTVKFSTLNVEMLNERLVLVPVWLKIGLKSFGQSWFGPLGMIGRFGYGSQFRKLWTDPKSSLNMFTDCLCQFEPWYVTISIFINFKLNLQRIYS